MCVRSRHSRFRLVLLYSSKAPCSALASSLMRLRVGTAGHCYSALEKLNGAIPSVSRELRRVLMANVVGTCFRVVVRSVSVRSTRGCLYRLGSFCATK